MVKKNKSILIVAFLILTISFSLTNAGYGQVMSQETGDAKAFKVLRGKSIDPKTGLPTTLDPSLIRGEDRKGYVIAKQIPEVLVQLPCFCGCEAVGHQSLLDCFVDRHAVG